MENDTENVKISDEAIAVCASRAALEVPGVASLSPGFTSAITEGLFGRSPEARGVRVSHESGYIQTDLYINVGFGVSIPAMAWKIQEQVKKAVEELTGLKVSGVNVHVQGIES